MDKVSAVMEQVGTALSSAVAVVSPVVTMVIGIVADILAKAGAILGPLWSALLALLATTPLGPLYLKIFGPMGQNEFLMDFLPLIYVSVLPLLCLLFAVCRLCDPGGSSKAVGFRVLRRTQIAVKAEVRMQRGASGKFKGITSLSSAEKGKAKKAISPPAKANPRRY